MDFLSPVFWVFGVSKNNFALDAGVFQQAAKRPSGSALSSAGGLLT